MTPGVHWGDDSGIEPPNERTSNLIALIVVGFVGLVCAALLVREVCG